MNEGLHYYPESPRNITREEVIDAYRSFVEQGFTSPDSLDLADPAVQEANQLFDEWRNQEDANADATNDPELAHRVNLSKNMFYVDTGFTDPEYLRDVLGWLHLDSGDVEKQPNNPDRVETRNQIVAAIHRVKALLKDATEKS